VNVRTIGDDIERLLDELQAKLDPRAFEQSVELVQLVTELYGAGMTRIVELVGESFVDDGPRFVRRLAEDDLVASLLVVHGLHPDGLPQRIAAALDGVRPFLGGHGGDVELLDIDEEVGAVHLRLLGSCDGCPSSAVTLRLTVERAIFEAAPEITIIDVDEPTPEPVRTPVTLIRKAGTHTIDAVASDPPTFDPATGCGAML
jgi:Fe-S cluster biogenesis protein NfuA